MKRRPAYGAKPDVLRCSRCGKFVNWEDARLQIICGCRPRLDLPPVFVREAGGGDREEVMELFRRDFDPAQLVAYGEALSLEDAPTLVAETGKTIAGALAWRLFRDAFHVIALATDPMWQRAGVGGHLLAEAELLARRHQQPRVVVTITNDNLPALYFYQRRSYRLEAVLPDAAAKVAADRGAVGFAGIPIRDELQLVKALEGSQ